MLRLVWSVVLAGLVGGTVAALAVKVFGIATMGAILAYPLAVLVGVVVALLAGKPFWTKDARIECGLKAGFGALLAAGLMYAMRAWVGVDLDLSWAGLSQAPAGQLPVVALPSIALVLSLLFEVDNMFGKSKEAEALKKTRVAPGKVRVDNHEVVEAELEASTNSSNPAKR